MSKKLKVELHTHTNYSYDSDTEFQKIIKQCQEKGIDVLGIADHNEIEGAFRMKKMAPFPVIVGEEILTKEGEVIGLFLNEYIPPGLSLTETIRKIKNQGGLTYLPHPFDSTTRKTSLNSDLFESVIDKIDIVEVHNGRSILNRDNKKSLSFAKKYKKLFGVGSDAHTHYEFGRNYLLMDAFSTPREFLEKMENAKHKTAHVLPWAFLLTKWARFKKKNFPQKFLLSEQDCDLCGSRRMTIIYKERGKRQSKYYITDNSYGVHSQIIRCLDCGLVSVHPRDTNKEILKRYAEFEDPKYDEERYSRAQNHIKTLDTLERLSPQKGKLLDIGCATGILLEQAVKRGWKGIGVETSSWASNLAKAKYKLLVYTGTIENKKLKKESFDAITCVDVIEHVTSPKDLVTQAHRLLKKGGLFCVVTPDRGGFIPRILGEKWWHIRPDHLYYFDQNSLNLLLESSGFKVEYVTKPGWSFSYSYWISRFQRNVRPLYLVFKLLEKIPVLNIITKQVYTFNFYDSIAIYCRKI